MKLSKFKKGYAHVVTQEVLSGTWSGSVFVWRCRKDSYAREIPTALNIPFNTEDEARDYGLRCFNEGFRCRMRQGNRTQGAWEVQVFFPMGFTIKNAIQCLQDNPFLARCE